MRLMPFLFLAVVIAGATAAHAIEFRDYYEPGEIEAYHAALKRKDFRAQIHWKPLIVAAADNADINTVRWMLENGVKADVADATGRTGLFHLASRKPVKIPKDYAEIARLLLVSGADPNRFASGTSVVRTLVAGNRDINTLKILLAHGANPNGNAGDLYPPVCGAATPEFVDVLVAAGAALQFSGHTDFSNAADCITLDDVDKKERKIVLRHLAEVYGIEPSEGKRTEGAAQTPPETLMPAGIYLYSEQTHPKPAWGERPQVSVDYLTVTVLAPMLRKDIIETLVEPENFRRKASVVSSPSLQQCAKNCDAELAEWRAFAERNRLQREFVRHVAGYVAAPAQHLDEEPAPSSAAETSVQPDAAESATDEGSPEKPAKKIPQA